LDACAICPCAGGGMVGTNLGKKNCTSIFVASSNVSNDFCGAVFLRGMVYFVIRDEFDTDASQKIKKLFIIIGKMATKNKNKPSDSPFKQQRLKAWQPILTPNWVVGTFMLIGVAFVPIGIALLSTSNSVRPKKT
jgi:hypothetical protein